MNENYRKRIDRLILYQGRPNYYATFALQRYLDLLKGVKFLEIRNVDGKFVGLLSVSEFKRADRDIEGFGYYEDHVLGEFLHFLEQSEIEPHYSANLITNSVTEDTGLIQSLKIMKNKRINYLAVLDENEKVLGVLSARTVEKRIVDEVLAAKEGAR